MYLQQLILLGRATKGGEVLESKEGKKYAKFGLAVNEYMGKGKDERTTFYNVLVFNKKTTHADKIKKGDLVLIQGRPETDPYLGNDGKPKSNLVVFADQWRLLK